MLKRIIVLAALQACVVSMEANAWQPGEKLQPIQPPPLTLYQIYGGDNGSAVRIYRTPTDGTAPSMEMIYDHRSRAVPSLPQYDELPGTRRNRYLQEEINRSLDGFLED